MAQYGEPDMTIKGVSLDNTISTGSIETSLEVTVRDMSQTAGSSGYNAFFLHAYSPQLAQSIISYCSIIQPGETKVVDGSSGDVEGYDGEFPLRNFPTNITVEVGIYELGVNCRPSNLQDMQTQETQTAQANVTSGKILENITDTIENISTGPGSATMTYKLNSNFPFPTTVQVKFTPGNQTQQVSLGGGEVKEIKANFSFDSQTDQSVQLCGNMKNASVQ